MTMKNLFPYPKFRALDSNGVPLAGGKVYSYATGTTTKKDTYSDYACTTANDNPVILDSNGEAIIYFDGEYTIVLQNSSSVTIWTMDNLQGMPNADEVEDQVAAVATSVRDIHRNLVIINTAVHPTYQVDVNADEIISETTTKTVKRLTSVNLTIDITASGANGLDTGAEANNTWYYIWVIAKSDGTTAGLLSISPTAPTLPTGYTYQALVGAIYNRSGNFDTIYQLDKTVVFDYETVLSSGGETSYTAISLAAYVPTTAKKIKLSGYLTHAGVTSCYAYISPFADGFGMDVLYIAGASGTLVLRTTINVTLYESQTIYYMVGNASTDLSLQIIGWEY